MRTNTARAPHAMICSVDQLASLAGVEMMRSGGTAVDAAIAANAVLAVSQQHMCGLGGDLFCIVHEPGEAPTVVNASGRAGSGANAEQLRAAGHTSMPHRGHIAAAPVPGCVDGWSALHERYGSLPWAALFEPAIAAATSGFAVSPLLAHAARSVAAVPGNTDIVRLAPGDRVRRPGVARTLQAIASQGRAGFYEGEFGAALVSLGDGEYADEDVTAPHADWVTPLGVTSMGHDVWTVPPNSQGYLTLAGLRIAEGLDLPADPTDPAWAHLLIESARAAAFDRTEALHEHADGNGLVAEARLAPRRSRIERESTQVWGDRWGEGDTMYLCAVDPAGMGVSLIQSNARDFGSHIVVGDTGIFLHNRGLGFSLVAGHPAEYGPGRRPPHTLAPALVTRDDGSLRAVLGTMGGDAQPHVVLQLLMRLLSTEQSPAQIISAGRFRLDSPDPASAFETWSAHGEVAVMLEPHCSPAWEDDLRRRGHRVAVRSNQASSFGHAHLIDTSGPTLSGAADPRAVVGAALGY